MDSNAVILIMWLHSASYSCLRDGYKSSLRSGSPTSASAYHRQRDYIQVVAFVSDDCGPESDSARPMRAFVK